MTIIRGRGRQKPDPHIACRSAGRWRRTRILAVSPCRAANARGSRTARRADRSFARPCATPSLKRVVRRDLALEQVGEDAVLLEQVEQLAGHDGSEAWIRPPSHHHPFVVRARMADQRIGRRPCRRRRRRATAPPRRASRRRDLRRCTIRRERSPRARRPRPGSSRDRRSPPGTAHKAPRPSRGSSRPFRRAASAGRRGASGSRRRPREIRPSGPTARPSRPRTRRRSAPR